MRKWSRIGILFLFGILFSQMGSDQHIVAAQTWHYLYAYVTQDTDQSKAEPVTLNLIDPAYPEAQPTRIALPHAEHVKYGVASPDGQWLTMLLYNYQDGMAWLRLLNLNNGQMQDIASLLSAPFLDDDMSGKENAVLPRWSPDSHYLALNLFVDADSTSQKNVLYVPATGELITLAEPEVDTNGGGKYVTFESIRAWSPDSTRIVTIATTCRIIERTDDRSGCFNYGLKVYSVPEMKVVATHKFDRAWAGFCQIALAPGNLYLVFRPYCSFDAFPLAFEELFTWDLTTNQISQLTHNTNPNPTTWKEAPPERHARYSLIWLDNKTLLVSVVASTFIFSVGTDPNSLVTRTEFYSLPDTQSHMIDANFADDWLLNPSANRLTSSWSQLTVVDNRLVQANAEVRIGRLANGKLETEFTGPMGCALQWSPDGTTLAYIAQGITDNRVSICDAVRWSPNKIFFINVENGQIRAASLTPPLGQSTSFVIGWLRFATGTLIVPWFPNGTPTPVPTQGPLG